MSEGSIKAFTEAKASMKDSEADNMELEKLVEQALKFLKMAKLKFLPDHRTQMITCHTAASKTIKEKCNTQRVVSFG
jgi:hypothetical protein